MKSSKLLKTCFITSLIVVALLVGFWNEKKTAKAATSTVEMPEYGGTLNFAWTTNIQGWDHAKYPAGFLSQMNLIYDSLVIDDWSKGLAGTGEANWNVGQQKRIDYTIGELAESFELPEQGKFIFHIRHGVHFALNPNNPASQLVGGREVTADDVVFSLKRQLESPMCFLAVSEPQMAKSTTVTKIDDWTVEVRTPPSTLDPMWLLLPGREIIPPEIVQKYGDLTDWRNAVGTGPFMATEYVPGSSVTFIRNPNYFLKDPCGPGKGNQLPYIDAVKVLIMPDISTQLAALRTGKVDQLSMLTHDDAVSLIKTNPELQYDKALGGSMIISMRTDRPDLPFKDKRVRQALMMAIDFEAIRDILDGGDSEILSFPLANIKGYQKAFMPMDEMPDSVKALYSHNVKKAKQLLADAGYADGFKTKVATWNNPDYIDFLSLVKDMWSEIGVDLAIQPLEFGAYMGLSLSKKYDEMMYSFFVQPGPYAQLFAFRGPSTFNRSWVSDSRVDATYQEILKYNLVDQAKVDKLHHDLMPYVLEQAWYIPRPNPYMYTFWQPWVKNYHGEIDLGYNRSWPKFIWIDQKLKEKMTGR
jgi:peptide/nickel transport system substrate-binding protein